MTCKKKYHIRKSKQVGAEIVEAKKKQKNKQDIENTILKPLIQTCIAAFII